MYENAKIQVFIPNLKYITLYYSYNAETTFQDLLEYIAYLFPENDICDCHKFTYYNNYYNNEIPKNYRIKDSKNILGNLIIYRNGQNCSCGNNSYLKCSKKIICDNYSEENKALKKENISNKKKIELLEKNNSENKKKYEGLKRDYEDQKKQFDYLTNENTNLKNEIKSLELKKNELIKNNKMLELAINGDHDKIAFLKEQGITGNNLKTKDNLIKIDPKSNMFIGNEKLMNKKFIDFYDVIIHINSIKDINKGWPIEISQRAKENYEKFKNQKLIRIGIIGNSNKGKSFLLSKLSKIDLPSGTSIRTEGLSIKYPVLEKFKDRRIALLDSAGLETPVLQERDIPYEKKNELFKEKSREKLITELFLQNYIINNSDILIAVVGILTYSEQKLLMKIKKEMERSKFSESLFIIHNLITYTAVEQVNDYIEKYLKKSATFKLVEGLTINAKINTKKGRFFYENIENSNQKIFHLIYANECSDAGKYFNEFTLEFVERSYQNVIDIKSFDVIETLKERYIQLSKDIIEKTSEDKIDKNSFDDSNAGLIRLKDNKQIVLKKCLTDELGFSNLKANGFEPTYNLFKKGDSIFLRIESPGNCSLDPPDIEFAGEYNIIKLKGDKQKDKDPLKEEDNIHNTREYGKFLIEIPLKAEEYLLSNEAPKIEKKSGVFIVEFKLSHKVTSEGYKMKVEDEI